MTDMEDINRLPAFCQRGIDKIIAGLEEDEA